MKKLLIALAVAGLTSVSTASHAFSCTLHSSNTGIAAGSFSCALVGTTITINETWTSLGLGTIVIDGLASGVDYTVVKNITNSSGTSWDRFANELLDPSGQANDSLDPNPQPGFVPSGFSTSNDFDGLSFAQGSGLPRTSGAWASVFADELSDARDFLDFFDGILADGGLTSMTFGLRDNNAANQPFLLAQRANVSSREIPEPGTLALLGLAAAGLALRRRKG